MPRHTIITGLEMQCSGTVLAQHELGPGFSPQYHKEKNQYQLS